jgi:hypothetical protein
VYSVGICSERGWLLRKQNDALRAHAKILGDLSRIAGTYDPTGFQRIHAEAQQAWTNAQAAQDAYRKHIHKHGCEKHDWYVHPESEPFQHLTSSQCDRCLSLFDALMDITYDTSQATVAACRLAGTALLDDFRNAILAARSLRQECAAIRQEYREHLRTHGNKAFSREIQQRT